MFKHKGARALVAALVVVVSVLAAGCGFFQKHPEILTDEGKSLVLCVEGKFDQILLAEDKVKAAEKVAIDCGGKVTVEFILALLDFSSKAQARAAAARAPAPCASASGGR